MTTTEANDISIYEHVRQSEIDAERARLVRDAREFPLPAVPANFSGPPATRNPQASDDTIAGMQAARDLELRRPRTPAQIDAWIHIWARHTSAARQRAIDEENERARAHEDADRKRRTCGCCGVTRPYPPQRHVIEGATVTLCGHC